VTHEPGALFAAAAAALVGVPFRLHGRNLDGVDCVGLVALALGAIGRKPSVPVGYRLRALTLGPLLQFAERNGFVISPGAERPGDLVLVHPCPLQAHLVIASAQGGFVHAHAGLGRVIHEQRHCPWPIAARWRLNESTTSWQP